MGKHITSDCDVVNGKQFEISLSNISIGEESLLSHDEKESCKHIISIDLVSDAKSTWIQAG